MNTFIELNPQSRSPIIILGEHAGFAIPSSLQALGVPKEVYRTDLNFAGDHGVRTLLFDAARKTGATTIMGRYSRLVVDLNRDPHHPNLFWTVQHGKPVPGNAALSAGDRAQRMEQYFYPFHDRVRFHIERLISLGIRPTLVTIHSYTPAVARACANDPNAFETIDIGLIYKTRGKAADFFDAALRTTDWTFGHNHPYDLRKINSGSLVIHQDSHDLDGVALEINVDTLRTHAQQKIWASFVSKKLKELIKE